MNVSVTADSPSSAAAATGSLLFDDFELRLDTCELLRGGRSVPLQHQPARILALLARHAGQAVSREQIRREIWGDRHFVDFEQALNFSIRKIRVALGDEASEPRYVATVPRYGYRFLPPVRPAQRAAAADEPARREPPRPRSRAGARLAGRWMLGALAAAAIATAWMGGWRQGSRGVPLHPRLAVLPLAAAGGAAADRWLSDGLTEDLIAELTRRYPSRLAVIAATSTLTYGDRHPPVLQVARELGADYVLEGSLRRRGDRATVTVDLVDAASGARTWGGALEAALGDFPQLPRELAGSVGQALRIAGREVDGGAVGRAALPPAAYEAYLEGLYLAHNGDDWRDRQRAIELLQRAATLAPGFAAAQSETALARLDLSLPAARVAPGVEAAARRALDLDPENSVAHIALGQLALFFQYDLGRAGGELERALADDPGSAEAHHSYACYLAAVGRFAEAIAAAERARGLDPFSRPIKIDLIWFHYLARQYDAAIEQARRALRLDPEGAGIRYYWLLSALMQNDAPAALAQAQTLAVATAARLREPAPPPFRDIEDFWRWKLALVTRIDRRRPISPAAFGMILAGLGERSSAVDRLQQACDQHFGYMVPFLAVDPLADSLRGDARFAGLMRCGGHRGA